MGAPAGAPEPCEADAAAPAASEPNLKVRSRLKQKVAERRSSPLLRRKDGTVISTFKKRAIEITGEPGAGSASVSLSRWGALCSDGGSGRDPAALPCRCQGVHRLVQHVCMRVLV